MDLGIHGRVAIISGGSAGMGLAAARSLAMAGVDLFVSARGPDRLMSVCKELALTTGRKVTPVVADHGTEKGRALILDHCPSPDILIVTSSPPPTTDDYTEITTQQWEAALSTGLIGPVELMKAVAPGMAERRFGRIVNISTVAAKSPLMWRALSGPPRAALMNYMVALSKRVASKNVSVNAVLPGLFQTEGSRKILERQAEARGVPVEEEIAKQVKRFQIPAKKLGNPEDVGAFCAMLCSQYAGYITGQAIVIDGGITTSTF